MSRSLLAPLTLALAVLTSACCTDYDLDAPAPGAEAASLQGPALHEGALALSAPASLIPASLAPGFAGSLTLAEGCADTALHAWRADEGAGLTLYVDGLMADAEAAGGALEVTVDAADLDLFVDVGQRAATNYCTDALEDVQIDATWIAIAGQVRVGMALDGDDGVAEIELMNVIFEDDRGRMVSADAVWSEIQVARYWGG